MLTPTLDGGMVAFTDSATTIAGCDAVAVSGGTATCTVTYSSAGRHSITGSYGGDPEFEPSTSSVLAQSVIEPVPGPPDTGPHG
jgi:hypothetical protein